MLGLRYDHLVSELVESSAVALRALLSSRQVSPTEVATAFLSRIDRLNPQIGAFCRVDAERAITSAQRLELDAERYPQGVLWGMPIGDKDLSQRRGVPTGYGSRSGGALATQDSADTRALDAAGAVSLGRTTSSEFGLYGYTSPAVGPIARNPADLALGAGGSSGGAAAAVAAKLLPFAPGSDGGGSIRIPAASVGVVGFKPSREFLGVDRGAGSTTGVVTGAIARSMADAALLLDAFTGHQPSTLFRDALHVEPSVTRVGVTLGSPWHAEYDIPDNPVAAEAVQLAQRQLEAVLNSEVSDELSFPNAAYKRIFKTAWQRAAAAIDARFDREVMESVTQQQIDAGLRLTSTEVEENRRELRDFGDDLARGFAEFDVVVTPSLGLLTHSPTGWSDDADLNFDQQVLMAPYSSWVNVAGLPAVTLPTRISTSSGSGAKIPVSIQLIGRRGEDARLASLAALLEPLIS